MGNHSTRSDLEGGRRSRAARSAETPGRFRTNRRWGQVGSRAGIPVMSGTAFEAATASAPPALGKMTTKPGMGGYSRFRGLSRLDSLRKLVEDVGRAMHPAALLGRLRPDFTQGLPEAQRAIADRESRRFEATAVQSTKHGEPALRALAIAGHPLMRKRSGKYVPSQLGLRASRARF
jgi:hypothetical protein